MKHKFKTIRVDKSLPLPYQKRDTDAGHDLYAAEDAWVWPLQTKTIKSNHRILIKDTLFALMQSRSGIRSKGLFIDGVIDEGYQGVWGIMVTNISWFPKKINKGDRLCQGIYLPYVKVEHDEVEEFMEETDRGNSGGLWRKNYDK